MNKSNMLELDADAMAERINAGGMSAADMLVTDKHVMDMQQARIAELEARLKEAEGKVNGLWAEIDSHRAHVKHLEESRDVYEKRAEKAEARAEAASKREGESFMLAADIQREKVKLEADAGRLRAVVEALEWIGRQIPYCPWCLCSQADGHSPACARQAALSHAEAGGDDAGFVWPKNEVQQVKAKPGETRVRPPFTISDDE